ncbi:unnamed protein product [Prorocentrum cordatum]|uniref:RanBP2-type domain-containing protein n=1 Tax=Prorocentrum cordatum TaxID=2364126 RepID=A0ABN9URL9_9DINO|nr:unnamed protein product [Polarella glacialis]
MAMVRATNSLFVRRLSSQVSEAFLRQLFSKCDEIERIMFKSFPGRSTEFYAQIDFKSSRGVVEGHKLSGTPFFGVPCEVSVMDPGQKDTMKSLEEQREQQACATLALRGQEEEEAPAEPQGVQAEAIRKYRETSEDKRLRTVHVAGLEKGVEEEALRVLLTSNFGAVENIRLDEDDHGDPFALVEFKDRGAATAAKMQHQVVVDGRVFAFSESRTLINTMAFTEETVYFTTPEAMRPPTWQAALALKENLTPKIAKARAAAAEIAQQPLDEETKEQLAIAEGLKQAPEFQWAGRSEKDPLVPRRRHRSWGRHARDRGSSRGSEDRHRDKKKKKARKGRSGSTGRDRDGEEGAEGDDEGPPVDLEEDEGLDLAVVPNTEVLACSSQSTSDDEEDQAPGVARRARAAVVSEEAGGAVSRSGARAAGPAPAEAAAPTVSIDVLDAPAAPAEPIAVQDVPPPPAEPIAVPDVPPPPLHPIRLDEDEAPPRGADHPAPGAAPLAPAAARGLASSPGGLPLEAAASRATPAVAAAALPGQAPDAALRAAEAPPDSRRARRLAAVRRAAAAARLRASGAELQRWECPSCGEPNKPSRELCNNCDAPAPWLGQISDGDSDASSSNQSASADAGPQSVEGSPVKSVGESPARSVAGSGSARSVSDVPEMDVDDSSSSGEEAPLAKLGQVSKEDGIQWEADVVRGELADARARIFHAGAEDD